MKFAYSSLVAMLVCAVAVVAKPGKSPICDTATAKDAFAASPMAPNKKNLAQENSFTFTADSATYSPGQRIVISMDGTENFQGLLLYVAPVADPSKRVGKFEIPAGFQNNGAVCQNSEFPESSITHTAGQNYEPKQQIVFEAPAADQGALELHAIVLVTVAEGGFGWGIWPSAVKFESGTPSLDRAPVNGITPMPNEVIDEKTECPPPHTATLVRKCKIKEDFKTTLHFTTTLHMTETKTETMFETRSVTQTITVTEPCTTTNAVLGEEETPMVHETPMMHEPPKNDVLGEEETPNNYNYNNDYKDNYKHGSHY